MPSQSATEHRARAKGRSVPCAVLTVSDTRTRADDKSGAVIVDALQAAGHDVKACAIVKDEADQIERQLRAWVADPGIEVVCSTGGTGISSRDTTIEVVERLLSKRLDGFGELFRMLSWDEVRAAAMISRAVAGLAGETFIFAMPGSSNAVKLGMTNLIIPELGHLVWERRR